MTPLRHFIGLVIGVLTCASAWAQTPEQLAQIEPAELYFQAWSLTKDAERLEEQDDFISAFTKYRKAQTFFEIIALNHPAHKTDLVKDKIEMTTKSMEKIHDEALSQQSERQEAGATPLLELPGQIKPKLVIPEQIDRNGMKAAEIQKGRMEVDQLENQLANIANPRGADAARLRGEIAARKRELAQLAAAPLRNDIVELKQQIEQLRGERDAMERARDLAVADQIKTQTKLEDTQKELADSKKEEQRLLAMIAKVTEINGKVVEGQLDQINEKRKEIAEKDEKISEFYRRNQDLQAQLDQSGAMVAQLRKERESLLAEKDQWTALMQMSEKDRLQSLINTNVGFSKDLNDAQANLKLVEDDANSSKETILHAKQALGVAKFKIQNLQAQNTEANLSLNRMKERLAQAEGDLLAQLNGEALNERGREEVTMLRQVINKLNAKIAAQDGAAALLLEQANRMGADDEIMAQAMSLVNGDEKMVLTAQEEDLLARTAQGVNFTNAIRPSKEVYDDATGRLRRLTDDLNGVAHRLFAKGDFQAARGNLALIIDEDPGSWEAMVNLGIVHMRLNDPAAAAQQFRKAILIAGDRKIPFAHFMLGDALYHTDLLGEAEEELRRSLALEPINPEAHVILGAIAGKAGRIEDAEFHFKEAIAQNPDLSESYLNLAIIDLGKGKLDEARGHYKEYLLRGGSSRPSLEEKLGM